MPTTSINVVDPPALFAEQAQPGRYRFLTLLATSRRAPTTSFCPAALTPAKPHPDHDQLKCARPRARRKRMAHRA